MSPTATVLGEPTIGRTGDAFLHEGVSGLHRVGIDRALFLGTPAESKWAARWRLDPAKTDPDSEVAEVASYAEWLALPPEHRARGRYVLDTTPHSGRRAPRRGSSSWPTEDDGS